MDIVGKMEGTSKTRPLMIGLALLLAVCVFNIRFQIFKLNVSKTDGRAIAKNNLDVKRHILAAAQYMPPPFDSLLSDELSPLFVKVEKGWNESIAIANSRADVFVHRIRNAVGDENQLLHYAYIHWQSLADAENSSVTDRARIRAGICGFDNARTMFLDWLEKNDSTKVPTVYSDHYNENWGFFSTTIPGRTAGWAYIPRDPRWKELITDNKNFVALFSDQHHNFSDPELDNKILSLPIGGKLSNTVWREIKARPSNLLRDIEYDLTVGGASGATRLSFFCHFVKSNHFPRPVRDFGKVDQQEFIKRLITTRYIYTPPGIGYDCQKNWDVLLSGAIPIMERGVGLERTYAFLPSFWIDSYFNLTQEMLILAYPLYVALREEFDFTRLSMQYWKNLVHDVAVTKSDELLRVKHPFPKKRVIWPAKQADANLFFDFPGGKASVEFCNLTN